MTFLPDTAASAAMGRSRLASWLLTATAVLIGFLLGFFLIPSGPQEASAPTASDQNASRSQNGKVQLSPQLGEESMAATRKRPRTEGGGEVGFSRKQWRMLQDDPELLHIDLGQCLAWQGVREVPIIDHEGFAPVGIRMEPSHDGPDLSAIHEFFGLDEAQSRALADALKLFGERLRTAESRTEHAEYQGDGTMRISFPGGKQDRQSALQALEKDLHAAIGPQNAGRLWTLSGFAKESASLESGIQAWVSVSDRWLRMGLSDGREVIFSRPDQLGGLDDHRIFGIDGILRTRHLKHRIDWNQLQKEAVNREEK